MDLEQIIENADEWTIRELISNHKFTIVGDLSSMLSIGQMRDRELRNDKATNKAGILAEYLEDNTSRLEISICDMLVKHKEEVTLAGGDIKLDMGWIKLSRDLDKYHILLIIRKFLDHQREVHDNNMSSPSKTEIEDYALLRQLHDYVLTDAEHWVNREMPLPKEIKADDVEAFLNSGGSGEIDTVVLHKLSPMAPAEDTINPFSVLNANSKW